MKLLKIKDSDKNKNDSSQTRNRKRVAKVFFFNPPFPLILIPIRHGDPSDITRSWVYKDAGMRGVVEPAGQSMTPAPTIAAVCTCDRDSEIDLAGTELVHQPEPRR